ncbi:hypothetical protein DS745_22075 [Anaerobacillus alkaliphilus]|uniref:Spore germination protein n=1 Tax=Anaerobacillus alkaliphilus TaxID=1548597 RepID=A0A4Q0VPY6_9BACI|nr:hypothetical protein [Anaerobacillus alkaliphilus]RXI96405.1 hypothetical protein DS745_22075 [Anaerobacillus alkaliphilus]
MAINFVLGAVNVNVNNTNAGVFIGQNSQSNWDSHQKRMPAIGVVNGISNISAGNIASQIDNDLADMVWNELENVPSPNSQAL